MCNMNKGNWNGEGVKRETNIDRDVEKQMMHASNMWVRKIFLSIEFLIYIYTLNLLIWMCEILLKTISNNDQMGHTITILTIWLFILKLQPLFQNKKYM